tara:strand:+ start:122 stop:628 length:507 start_codon:yes stop_codon:yes gene_type:complete
METTNERLSKMNGSQLYKFKDNTNFCIDEIIEGISNGLFNNDLNQMNRSLCFLQTLEHSLQYFIYGNKDFKKQLFQYHKNINPKLTKEEIENLISEEKKFISDTYKDLEMGFSVDFDKHRNEVKNIDDNFLKLKLNEEFLNEMLKDIRFKLKVNESNKKKLKDIQKSE